ncbi:MAG TPA: GMP synthase [Flavisolibacter sp.]|jgi:GMP synthase-like glutamine amidotransferase|nr:GMP synthase [Flavisolibacter sp.]
MLRIALLDLYAGHANQGMRCIRTIIKEWSENNSLPIMLEEFDVRQKDEAPDLSYDIYISSGGPGDPMEGIGSKWEEAYYNWLDGVVQWNSDPLNDQKKHVFFICHSFQLATRYFKIGQLSRRKSTAFGVFPVHVLLEGQHDPVFEGLKDPFYVVDSRDYQVTSPDFDQLKAIEARILCIEKYRPHVPLEQAIMGIRFNDYMIGTQFHPEADAIGMSMYFQTEEKKQMVIENYGAEKWKSMVDQLNDPDKIMFTYAHVLPNFLNLAAHSYKPVLSVDGTDR